MPIKSELLEILCCPATKVSVKLLTAEQLDRINQAIQTGAVRYVDQTQVEKPIHEGLITEDGQTIYEIANDIPIMLIDKGIAASSIHGL